MSVFFSVPLFHTSGTSDYELTFLADLYMVSDSDSSNAVYMYNLQQSKSFIKANVIFSSNPDVPTRYVSLDKRNSGLINPAAGPNILPKITKTAISRNYGTLYYEKILVGSRDLCSTLIMNDILYLI